MYAFAHAASTQVLLYCQGFQKWEVYGSKSDRVAIIYHDGDNHFGALETENREELIKWVTLSSDPTSPDEPIAIEPYQKCTVCPSFTIKDSGSPIGSCFWGSLGGQAKSIVISYLETNPNLIQSYLNTDPQAYITYDYGSVL